MFPNPLPSPPLIIGQDLLIYRLLVVLPFQLPPSAQLDALEYSH